MPEILTIVTAEQLVAHFNTFKSKKLRKRDFTEDNLRAQTAWAVNMNLIRYFSRENEPAIKAHLDAQRLEHTKAVQMLLKSVW